MINMSLEIIGAGFGRTGTHSLKLALEMLGFGPCHHMAEILDKPDKQAAWERAYDAVTADWEDLLRGYRSAVDWPSAYFWRQLAEHYPNARVILTIRDSESWYESTRNTIYPSSPGAKARRGMVTKMVWEGVFEGRFADKAHAISVYERHNETVRSTIDPARLLVLEASQGWEPLCDRLGCPIPKEPYPHSNTTADFRSRIAAWRTGSSS
jgi:hypothetical protein